MTRTSRREYTEAVRWRYLQCSKRDKGKILDEFTKVTGYHRKAAIRDNDSTAASSGINVFQLKLYSFLIAAFIMGMAGAVFYSYSGYIEPVGAFNIRWLLTALLATVIGGEGVEQGPIIGAVIVVLMHFLLARYTGISLIIQGVILVSIMLAAPQGIMGLIRKARAYRSSVTVSH